MWRDRTLRKLAIVLASKGSGLLALQAPASVRRRHSSAGGPSGPTGPRGKGRVQLRPTRSAAKDHSRRSSSPLASPAPDGLFASRRIVAFG